MFDDLDPKDFEDTARAAVESCAKMDDTSRRAAVLAEAGLLGVLAPEETGGLGLPMRFAVPVIETAGAGLLGFPLMETMLLAQAVAKSDPALATRITEGETVVTIAWAGVGEDEIVGGAPMATEADRVLVFRKDGTAVLAATGNALQPEAGDGFDVDTPEASVRLTGPLDGLVLGADEVDRLRAGAKVLRAAFIQGSAAKCLSLAADYAQERVQFGSPLSGYQVLRHRMARDALAIETLRSGIARALAEPPEGAELARDAVWLTAARSGPAVAESAIQVFGGMGFTWDVPLHRHLRQIRMQATYGAAAEGFDQLGDALLQGSDNVWYEDIEDGL
ncbi:MAG: acyl-CoA/acyl-ACP dehydrogenase [Sulfitobacter sp.]|nr:acyl-CoA/acyl-ACP dehydrogenase [Sulfitobacter sp.]